jgi:predicted transposase YbfD/YdcC
MKHKLEEGFLDFFTVLEDPRSVRNRKHMMGEILLTTLCAAVCGAEGWQDVEDFGNAKREYLRQFFPFKNGIPSDDTFRRFFRALNPDQFQSLFRDWIRSFQPNLDQGVIAIDGKSSRHTFDQDKKMLHMISAYASESGLVLAQEKVDEKSNEITAIPKMLEWLDVRGSLVTIDAMGCQVDIAQTIISKEGDYIFSLKGNQGSLKEDVQAYLDDQEVIRDLAPHTACDKGHGRLETRVCWVTHDVEWLHELHPKWSTIHSLIRIDSTREMNTKITKESRYYISSRVLTSEKALRSIRDHWSIENKLHWVLDMSFGEDQSRIRKENAPQCMAIIRHIALNLLQSQKNSMKRQSIKRLRKMGGWSDEILSAIISQTFS